MDLPPSAHDQLHVQPLSKNAQKKILKAERMKELKLERRARQKAAKKEKRRGRAVAPPTDDDAAEGADPSSPPDLTRKAEACETLLEEPARKRPKLDDEKRVPFKARVVVDLGFDNMMSDKEIISLCSQLHHTYAANRRAVRPFVSLLFTSLDGRTCTRLESLADASYRRWSNTEWWKNSYEGLWTDRCEAADPESDDNQAKPVQKCAKDKVVYLTADAGEELTELREDEVYIIGGICDHNRYKNLCQKKAAEGGIRSARLPIGSYMAQLQTRKVLTVNQVVEILLCWVETRDWQQALYKVMPKRKLHGAPQQPTETSTVSDVGKLEASVVKAAEEGAMTGNEVANSVQTDGNAQDTV